MSGLARFDAAVGPNHVEELVKFVQQCGFKSVHLTGGEPTLHPEVVSIIHILSQTGVKVGMTSHGEYRAEKIEEMVAAGLASLNVSMHAINPDHYLAMDFVAQGVEKDHGIQAALAYAEARLKRKRLSLQCAQELAHQSAGEFNVKVNCVVEDYERAKEVLHFCATQGIVCRFQANNNTPEESRAIIASIIAELGARPILIERSLGDSSSSGIVYEYDVTDGSGISHPVKFKVKNFDSIYVPEMCNPCELKDTPACRENFYGIRLEVGADSQLMVRLCIDRTEPHETIFSVEEFLQLVSQEGSIPHAVLLSYRQGAQLLWKQSILHAYSAHTSSTQATLLAGRSSAAADAMGAQTARESRYDTMGSESAWLANALDRMTAQLNKSGTIVFEPSISERVQDGSIQQLQFEGEDDDLSGWYLLASKPDTFRVDGVLILAVTPESPIGTAIHGKRPGDSFEFMVNSLRIEGKISEII